MIQIIYQHIKHAFKNLLHAKLKNLLAIIGVLVGTASVVAMVSCGHMATQAALAQFKNLGTDLLAISFYDLDQSAISSNNLSNQISLATFEQLQQKVSAIRSIAPYTNNYMQVTYHGKTLNAPVIGATENLADTIHINMQEGRFISFLDHYGFLAVIGNNLANNFGMNNPLGKQIQIGAYFFTVVGIARPWLGNSFFNQDIDSAIIIPVQTSLLLNAYVQLNDAVLRLKENADIDQIEQAITQYIQSIVPKKQLYFRSSKEIIQSMHNQQNIFTLLLGAIGSIALIVGGIGIMNIMLVSVMERRREIGIRRAIGATAKDIKIMFLSESILLSLVGGIAGILTGIIVSAFIAAYAGWHFSLFWLPPAIGFITSVCVGIFFGYYPASKAAKLNPIECLRVE